MEETQTVNGRALPREVEIRRDLDMRFTPRELRAIKEATGRSLIQTIGDDESDERFTVFAWLKLRREGYDLSLADMDDVIIAIIGDEPDPTIAPRSETSPHSAGSGE